MEQILTIGMLLLTVAVFFNYILTFALIRRQNAASQARRDLVGFLEVGQLAPDFTAETLNGETVTLASYAGRPVIFLFFQSGCEPCRNSLSAYELVQTRTRLLNIEMVLVSLENAIQTRGFFNEKRINLPIIIAPYEENSFKTDYRLPGTPSYCMVDGQGFVRSTNFADSQSNDWKKFVASLEMFIISDLEVNQS
ncbi:MAG: TlpA family protein disulfide reductase [Chloroflexales bacterium]|nr:TlpA family protein disulfide reductase [Chloroflexales bacterium]